MSEMFTRLELKAIQRYLSKVYVGVAEQDDLWAIAHKVDQLIKRGNNVRRRNNGSHDGGGDSGGGS